MARLYIIYDERAYTMDTDDAMVMCTADSMKEAREDRDSMFPGCPIYSYAINGDKLEDQRFEE